MIFKVRDIEVLIDDEDYYLIENLPWGIANKKGTIYIQHTGKEKTVQLARLIMGEPEGKLVDHINGNTLDNRKCNLRIADKRTNAQNMRANVNTTSKYKGVSYDKFRNKWRANIKVDNKQTYLGRFETEEEAAIAYNEAAEKYFGEYARLNIINPITVEI